MADHFALFVTTESTAYTTPGRPPALISFLLVLALIAIAVTPYIPGTSPIFGINLKALHVILALPVFLATGPALWSRGDVVSHIQPTERETDAGSLYGFLAGASLLSHVHSLLGYYYSYVGNAPFRDLWRTVFDNPCQTSVAADLLFASITAIFFMVVEIAREDGKARPVGRAGWLIGGALIISTPLLSVSTTFPAFLAWREGWRAISATEVRKAKRT